jgi:hypothetical protein
MKFHWSMASIVEWCGRVSAVALVLFWGAFLVHHVSEWFLQGNGRYPPPFVWFANLLHLTMLLGLLLTLFKPLPGAVATIITSLAFFGWIRAFPPIAAVNFIPPTLVAISYLLMQWSHRTASVAGKS